MAVYHEEEPGTVVGHLPREISRTSCYFSKHDGKIRGEVIGPRKYHAEAEYCIALAESICVMLESIDLYCAEGCRIIRGAEFLEDIR